MIRAFVLVASLACALVGAQPQRSADPPKNGKVEPAASGPARPAVPKPILAHIAKRLGEQCGGMKEDDLPDPAAVVTVTPVVVGGNGEKGLLVRTQHDCFCAAGNCLFQVWAEEKRGYNRIFEDDGHDIQLLKTDHGGRFDIVTEGQVANDKTQVVRYQWDGRKYIAADLMCRFNEGEIRKIVPGPCR